MNSEKKHAAIYTKTAVQSQEKGEEIFALVSQEMQCRQYCQEHGYEVVGVFSNLTELLEQAQQVNVVIVTELQRLSRNQIHLFEILDQLKQNDITVKCLNEPDVMDDQAFIEAVRTVVKEMERETRSLRIKYGIAAKKAQREQQLNQQ